MSQYEVTVAPSEEPNRGQFKWSVNLVSDGHNRIIRHVAHGTNDSNQSCGEQAWEAIQRDRNHPIQVRYFDAE